MARTVPVSATEVPGNFITSALWNAGPAACNTFLTTVPLCQVTQSAAQTMTNGVFAAITFDTTQLDTDGGHSNVTNNTRYTCQVPGWYLVIGVVAYSPNSTGTRASTIAKNGTIITAAQVQISSSLSAAINTDALVSYLVQMAVGDYVEIFGMQNSGGNLALATSTADSSMQVIWLHV